MTVDSTIISQLSTSAYHLKLLEQNFDEVKDPSHLPKPSPIFPSTDVTQTIQATIESIHSFQNHIETIPEILRVKVFSKKILTTATTELDKIEEILKNLPSLPLKTTLSDSVDSCKIAIREATKFVSDMRPPNGQRSAGVIAKLLASVGTVSLSLVDPSKEQERIDGLIRNYKTNLKEIAASDEPLNFANCVRQFVVTYLEEHLVHIRERESSLRPPFLEFFFDNVYGDKPTENPLCSLVKQLLKDHPEMIKATVELNLLKGLHQTYSTLKQLEKSPMLIDLMRKSFHTAIESVRKEEESRKSHGVNPLTVEQRNLFLSGAFQKNLVSFIFNLAFPAGAKDLELPEIISSKIPLVQTSMNIIKTKFIWPLLQEGLEDLTKSIFSELSFNEDVKNQILIEGYTQTIAFLEEKPRPPKAALDRLSRLSALSIGIVTVFFSIIFNALKKTHPKESSYPKKSQDKLNKDLYKTIEWLAEGSKVRSFICRRFGKRLADSVGLSITEALSDIKGADLLNQQLASITKLLTEQKKIALFSKTEAEEEAVKQTLAADREQDKTRLDSLRKQFGYNINGLIFGTAQALYPAEESTQLSKIRAGLRQFFQSCLYHFIRFVFKITRAQSQMIGMEHRFYRAAKYMEQDSILMATTSASISKIEKARKNLPKARS